MDFWLDISVFLRGLAPQDFFEEIIFDILLQIDFVVMLLECLVVVDCFDFCL